MLASWNLSIGIDHESQAWLLLRRASEIAILEWCSRLHAVLGVARDVLNLSLDHLKLPLLLFCEQLGLISLVKKGLGQKFTLSKFKRIFVIRVWIQSHFVSMILDHRLKVETLMFDG